MAGADDLSVEASVEVNGQPIAGYAASASSIRGGMFFPGSSPRFNNLANSVAKELVEEMSSKE